MTHARRLAALLLAASALSTQSVASAAPAPTPTLAASDAWIALGPPGTAPLAGYLTLANSGPAPAALVGVGSPAFARVELHSTVRDGNTMRMRRLPRLDLPAGGRVVLGPGQLHLMLFAPHQPLAAGQRIELELSFDDGSTILIDAEVRDPRAKATTPHDHGTP